MRHRKQSTKLSRTSSHRNAMLRNMLNALFKHEQIRTTREKARFVRPQAEKMITLGKKKGLANYRRALAVLQDKTIVRKLFNEIAPKFEDRPGGYTRILKLGTNRLGDNAPQVLFQLVSEPLTKKEETKGASATKRAPKVKTGKSTRASGKGRAQEPTSEAQEKEPVAPTEPEASDVAAETTGEAEQAPQESQS